MNFPEDFTVAICQPIGEVEVIDTRLDVSFDWRRILTPVLDKLTRLPVQLRALIAANRDQYRCIGRRLQKTGTEAIYNCRIHAQRIVDRGMQ